MLNKNMSDNIKCHCQDNGKILSLGKWPDHYSSQIHQEWINTDSNRINEIKIMCGCGAKYNYQNAHNHFRSRSHKDWQDQEYTRYDNVLIICRCGDIIRAKDRTLHDGTHNI